MDIEPEEERPDWEQIIGDLEFALKETDSKKEEVLNYIDENEVNYPRLALKWPQWRTKVKNMNRVSGGVTDEDNISRLKKKAFNGIFEKY